MSKFRFKITDGEVVSFTDWHEETPVTGAASLPVQAVKDLRNLYPDAAFEIERDHVPPMPSPEKRAAIEQRWMAAKES